MSTSENSLLQRSIQLRPGGQPSDPACPPTRPATGSGQVAGGLPPGGQGPRGPGYALCRGRREKCSGEAVGGGVEHRVRRAAQRRRLPGVGHHVREGTARVEAGDDAALPAVVGPPVKHSPSRQRGAQVAGWRRLDLKPVVGIGGGGPAGPKSGAGRGRGRPVACSKTAMAASGSQWVRFKLSSGSRVWPAASRPVQPPISTYTRPHRILNLNLSSSCRT